LAGKTHHDEATIDGSLDRCHGRSNVTDLHRATRRRRRRTALEAVILAIGVALLLWGTDALARAGAESLLERNIQDVTGVVERPVVEVHGTFLLPQAIRGAYDDVEVSVVDIRSGPLQIHRVDARLQDVRIPLRDLVLRDIRRVGIGKATDRVTLRFSDLNSYFEVTGRPLRLSGGDDGSVEMRGFFIVLGQTIPVTAQVSLSVDDSQLRITPEEIDTGSARLSQARRLLLDQQLNLTVPLDTLPFGQQLTEISSDRESLYLQAESTAVILRP
jgi:hypothetical protein